MFLPASTNLANTLFFNIFNILGIRFGRRGRFSGFNFHDFFYVQQQQQRQLKVGSDVLTMASECQCRTSRLTTLGGMMLWSYSGL